MSTNITLNPSSLSKVTDLATQLRYGCADIQPETFGLDPGLGDLLLYIADIGEARIPVLIPASIAEDIPGSSPVSIDGYLWTTPMEVSDGGSMTRLISQTVCVAVNLGKVDGTSPAPVQVEGIMGIRGLPHLYLLNTSQLPTPLMLQCSTKPARVASRVRVSGGLRNYDLVLESRTITLVCLAGTVEVLVEAPPKHKAASHPINGEGDPTSNGSVRLSADELMSAISVLETDDPEEADDGYPEWDSKPAEPSPSTLDDELEAQSGESEDIDSGERIINLFQRHETAEAVTDDTIRDDEVPLP